MIDHVSSNDFRSKASILLLFISLGFVVLIQMVIPMPDHEFRRVLVCGLELLFVVPYVGMLPDRTNFVVVRPAVAILLVIWITSSFAAVALSSHWAASLVRQGEWFCHLLFAASIWHFLRATREATRWVIGFVVFAAFSAVLLGVRSWFAMPAAADHMWPISFPLFSHIDHFGHVALVGLVLAHAGVTGHEARPVTIAASAALMAVFWGALIWSGSAVAFVCGVLAVVLMIIVLTGDARRRLLGVAPVSISLGALLSVGLPVRHAGMGLRGLGMKLVGADQGSFSRLTEIWGATWTQFVARPWFGHGPDAYVFFQPTPSGVQPQNAILQFMTDWGVAGALAFVMILLTAVGAAWVTLRETRSDLRAERVVAFVVVIVLSVQGLVGGTYYHAVTLMMLATCFAIAAIPPIYASTNSRPGAGVISLRTSAVRVVGVVVTSLFFVQATLLVSMSMSKIPDPADGRARFVRLFPSTTHNVDRWIASWEDEHPADAADWVHWAHEVSADAYFFSGVEARMLAENGMYEDARDHAIDALDAAPQSRQMTMAVSLGPLIDLGNAYSDQMLFGLADDSTAVTSADSSLVR